MWYEPMHVKEVVQFTDDTARAAHQMQNMILVFCLLRAMTRQLCIYWDQVPGLDH